MFGPFLTLLAGAGVASVTFGTSIWLAVLTIVVVSLLYRLVMRWIVDGSGGTGLAEEELGSWAAKITAALTCIEYTLTFLVSISALVTFVAELLLLHVDQTGTGDDVTGYLDLIAAWASPHVAAVSCHTVAGWPVEELLTYIDDFDIHVVVLSSHGRTGIRRAIAGSVTTGLVAGSTHSTVVVRSAAGLHRP